MVDFEMGAGFYVPRTDERRLRDLLDLNLRLLLTATHREAEIAVSAAAGDDLPIRTAVRFLQLAHAFRSEEHTSELQSLMRISYAVFCLKKKKKNNQQLHTLNQSTHSTIKKSSIYKYQI